MPPKPCRDDDALWPAVVGETVSDDLAEHLSNCPQCLLRTYEIRRRVELLRRVFLPSPARGGQAENEDRMVDTENIPSRIGDFAITGVLGHGGQAIV